MAMGIDYHFVKIVKTSGANFLLVDILFPSSDDK
jgi:hypothetical protein